MPIASPSSRFDAHHPREQRVRAEDAQQIVVEAQVEAAEAGIALAARAAAQLVVDAAALVALGAEHEQPAGGEHLLPSRRRPRP